MNEKLWTVYRTGERRYVTVAPGVKPPKGEVACYAVDEAAAKRGAAMRARDERMLSGQGRGEKIPGETYLPTAYEKGR